MIIIFQRPARSHPEIPLTRPSRRGGLVPAGITSDHPISPTFHLRRVSDLTTFIKVRPLRDQSSCHIYSPNCQVRTPDSASHLHRRFILHRIYSLKIRQKSAKCILSGHVATFLRLVESSTTFTISRKK